MNEAMVEIAGNTYPVRRQLAALGGRWMAAAKVWLVPADKAGEARRLVASAPREPKAPRRVSSRTCATCGCRINYGRFCGKCEFA